VVHHLGEMMTKVSKKYRCEKCGKAFSTVKALGGHRSHCLGSKGGSGGGSGPLKWGHLSGGSGSHFSDHFNGGSGTKALPRPKRPTNAELGLPEDSSNSTSLVPSNPAPVGFHNPIMAKLASPGLLGVPWGIWILAAGIVVAKIIDKMGARGQGEGQAPVPGGKMDMSQLGWFGVPGSLIGAVLLSKTLRTEVNGWVKTLRGGAKLLKEWED